MANELQSGAAAGAVETLESDFASLLQKEFKPNTDEKKSRIEQAVQTLAQQALGDASVISDDIYLTLEGMIAALDRKLSEQVNQVIHHPDFQQLESAWRGLNYLVMNTSTGKDLKIRVLNISKDETRKMLRQYKDAAWDQSPLFKKVYEAEFGQLGGQPFGAFTCDYYFDNIGSAAHAPFIAGTSPQMLGMQSWRELANPRDLAKQFDSVDYMAWRSFRDMTDSRYLALTMPRFLGRPIYGAKTNPVDEFGFEEETEGEHDNHLWVNAAYGLAVRITESFKTYGWCTRIRGVESGGTIEGLPTAIFPTDDGGVDAKCPTEIAISDRREAELSKSGFMALIHRKNTDQATFIGAQTVHAPKAYEDSAATANANLSARLPYIFASCRFAHYLKCMVRDWIGSNREAPQLQADLHSWIQQYVDPTPQNSTESEKAKQPLKSAQIQIIPDEENPGQYRGIFRFVPHYQFEGMDVSLGMVSRLPGAKG
jgi:type VI secretion system protein ImpC